MQSIKTLKFSHITSVLLIITLSILLLMTGCNKTVDLKTETAPTDQETAQLDASTSQPIDSTVDIEPLLLSEADKNLTLEGYGAIGALADQDLSIMDMLTYAAQDEYLAHAEYMAIINKFGSQRPYDNIISAEETHLSYLKEVYLSYALDFPLDTSADHIAIPADLLEAAKTGVQAEIDNIAMYEKFMKYDLPDNVYEVFTALKNGSDSHLKAFQNQVDKLSQ